jgi:hypothetical protein
MTHRARAPDGLDAHLLNLSERKKHEMNETLVVQPTIVFCSLLQIEVFAGFNSQCRSWNSEGSENYSFRKGEIRDSGGGPLLKICSFCKGEERKLEDSIFKNAAH